jgi:Ca2+-binding RTX toxin-like protein
MRRALLLGCTMALMLLLAAGVALAVTKTCMPYTGPGTECFGTKNADTLNGTDGSDLIYGRGRADTLNGFGAFDELYGQGGADKLFGSSGNDNLIGGSGKDALGGGEGIDTYYFGDGWGKDSLSDYVSSANEIRFSSVPYQGVVLTDDLIIDLTSGTGPEVRNASGTNTINWEGNVIDDVQSGYGDDEIMGNASANLIGGAQGDDTIFGEGGDDEIRVYDSDGSIGDTVHCGEGDDTVLYNVTGFLSDSIDSDCEHPIPNP